MQAMRRAAELARKTAIQTDTNLVVFEEDRIRLISPSELVEQAAKASKP